MYVVSSFLGSFRVILLSEYTRTVLFSSFSFCMYSKAFKIAKCSAWLLVRRTLFCISVLFFRFPPVKTANREPNPTSLLRPSV